MPFLRANIDRAIVMTQYDLRGFWHPLGFREEHASSPKSLSATTANLVAFAAGIGNHKPDEPSCEPTDEYAEYASSTFEDYLAMCMRLASECDCSQKEAIQLIVLEIVAQSNEMKAKVAASDMEPSDYLKPLDKENYWGRAVLALAEAFEVELEQAAE